MACVTLEFMSCEIIHNVKAGDTAVVFADHLKDNAGNSLELSGATVRAVMRTKSGTVLLNEAAEVLQTGSDQDKTQPNVRLQPTDGVPTTTGTHDFEWQVTLASGKTITRPSGGYHQVRVYEKLA